MQPTVLKLLKNLRAFLTWPKAPEMTRSLGVEFPYFGGMSLHGIHSGKLPAPMLTVVTGRSRTFLSLLIKKKYVRKIPNKYAMKKCRQAWRTVSWFSVSVEGLKTLSPATSIVAFCVNFFRNEPPLSSQSNIPQIEFSCRIETQEMRRVNDAVQKQREYHLWDITVTQRTGSEAWSWNWDKLCSECHISRLSLLHLSKFFSQNWELNNRDHLTLHSIVERVAYYCKFPLCMALYMPSR